MYEFVTLAVIFTDHENLEEKHSRRNILARKTIKQSPNSKSILKSLIVSLSFTLKGDTPVIGITM